MATTSAMHAVSQRREKLLEAAYETDKLQASTTNSTVYTDHRP